MHRYLLRLAWILSVYLFLCVGVAILLTDVTVHPYRRPLTAEVGADAKRTFTSLNARLTDVAINAQDHVSLRAWFVKPQHGNGEAVILLHGLGDNRMGTEGYAQILLARGYSVLMPDARAHGESGGDLATYGLIERNDIRQWFEWVSAQNGSRCIFGLGESMGAAQLLQSLSVEPNFCAVVAESSFSTFREIAYDRMGQRFNSGPWVGRTVLRPVVEIALLIARVRYHVDLTQASPEETIAHSQVPVFLIHGAADSNIPLRHSVRIQSRNPSVSLWEVPGADHCGAISAAPDEFEKRVTSWFESHQYSSCVVPRMNAYFDH
jgi:uncharacterized protein